MHLRINDTLAKENNQGTLSYERLIGTMSATQHIDDLASDELASAVNATIAYLKARGSGDALARDMAQDAVVRAMRSPKRTDATWATYLITIARRLRIDAAKRHATRVNNAVAVAETCESIETRDALTRLASNEGVVRLGRMLDALPEKQRRSLVLATMHGMSHGEIASVLGCAEGTVSSNISVARATIRKSISKGRR
jgi:RNA polymerase sigma-70 factor (ECF subfamily)